MQIPLLHIPLPWQFFGHVFTAQKSAKLEGHVIDPLYPETVRTEPGVVQITVVESFKVIVIWVPVTSQTET